MCSRLFAPQDGEITVEMIETELSKFGTLLGGRSGVNMIDQKFGSNRNVHVSEPGERGTLGGNRNVHVSEPGS